ncbi:hypothetical protein M1555_05660 [Patescibacteria group bacterium]|nr:hypothetical protein [Patescibacteria group bacterium]
MFDFIKDYFGGRKIEKEIFEGYKLISITIFDELFLKFKSEREEWTAQVLAAQTMNYLMGTSVEKVMAESASPLKEKIAEIIKEIPAEANSLMDNNPEIRNLVVQSLRFKQIIDRAHYGKSVDAIPETQQINQVLEKYGSSVTYKLDVNEYLTQARQLYSKNVPVGKKPAGSFLSPAEMETKKMNTREPFAFRLSYPCNFCNKSTTHVYFDFKSINENLELDTNNFPAFCTRCNLLVNIPAKVIEGLQGESVGSFEAKILLGRYLKQVEAANDNTYTSDISIQTSTIIAKRVLVLTFLLGIVSFFIFLRKTNVLLALFGSWLFFAISTMVLLILGALIIKMGRLFTKSKQKLTE